jgi:neutral trehalase
MQRQWDFPNGWAPQMVIWQGLTIMDTMRKLKN